MRAVPTDDPLRGDDLLNIGQAAALAQVSPASLRRWADRGMLPHVRTLGGQRRFRRADVEALARVSRSTEPAA